VGALQPSISVPKTPCPAQKPRSTSNGIVRLFGQYTIPQIIQRNLRIAFSRVQRNRGARTARIDRITVRKIVQGRISRRNPQGTSKRVVSPESGTPKPVSARLSWRTEDRLHDLLHRSLVRSVFHSWKSRTGKGLAIPPGIEPWADGGNDMS